MNRNIEEEKDLARQLGEVAGFKPDDSGVSPKDSQEPGIVDSTELSSSDIEEESIGDSSGSTTRSPVGASDNKKKDSYSLHNNLLRGTGLLRVSGADHDNSEN